MDSNAAVAAMRGARVLASAVLLWGVTAAYGQTNLPPVHLPAGKSLISLPRVALTINGRLMPPVIRAEDLRAAIPNAISVQKFITECDDNIRWDGGTCTGTFDPCPLGQENGAACGSQCFCLDPAKGLALMVELSAPATLQIVGVDGTSAVVLPGPESGSASGTERFSFPFDISLERASDVLSNIFASGYQGGVSVARFDNATESLMTYSGISGGNDFTLRPGEGYQIRVATTFVGYSPPLASEVSDGGPNVYRILGRRTASPMSWEIRDSAGAACGESDVPATGMEPADVARDLADSITANCGPDVRASHSDETLVLHLPTGGFAPPVSLLVFDVDDDSWCAVTSRGCDFNPRIVKIEPEAVPTLSEIGVMAFALLLAIGAVVLLVTRRSQSTAA